MNALTRQGIAALLSAASPGIDYPLTTDEVIALVNEGYTDFANGDAAAGESIKNTLDALNNLGAPGFC